MGDTRDRYYRIKQECIDALGGRCIACGTTENLEFDHIDPSTKSFDIISGSRISAARRSAELAKCQLLCGDHHAEKTRREIEERKAARPHGTKTRYNQGCRCGECREGQRLRQARYVASKRG